MMADKIKPIGICDLCSGHIPQGAWYTSKGKPRLHCCIDCRNTANSHAGEQVRYQKMIERIERGEWTNPAELRPPTPEEQAGRARKGRQREVSEGTWRNPALGEAARGKLSKPRKHEGALARAIEKLKRRAKLAELTGEEQEAYRAYRRELTDARRYEINRQWRVNYHRRKKEHEQSDK